MPRTTIVCERKDPVSELFSSHLITTRARLPLREFCGENEVWRVRWNFIRKKVQNIRTGTLARSMERCLRKFMDFHTKLGHYLFRHWKPQHHHHRPHWSTIYTSRLKQIPVGSCSVPVEKSIDSFNFQLHSLHMTYWIGHTECLHAARNLHGKFSAASNSQKSQSIKRICVKLSSSVNDKFPSRESVWIGTRIHTSPKPTIFPVPILSDCFRFYRLRWATINIQ